MTTRPADFDARVMSYLPMLRKQAQHLAHSIEDREDLVQDAVDDALRRWKSFREDGGFCKWLTLIIRGIASNRNKRKQIPIADNDNAMMNVATPPEQEHAVDLRKAVAAMRRMDKHTRYTVAALAAGYTAAEIGAKFGVTNQAVFGRVATARDEMAAGKVVRHRPYGKRRKAG